MLCKSFEDMTIVQKVEFIGKLNHIVQSSEIYFWEAQVLINKATKHGFLDNVKIIPNGEEEKGL